MWMKYVHAVRVNMSQRLIAKPLMILTSSVCVCVCVCISADVQIDETFDYNDDLTADDEINLPHQTSQGNPSITQQHQYTPPSYQ